METSLAPLLSRLAAGDEGVLDRLVPEVYEHLHQIAQRLMRAQPANHTLQATALVNEAYLKLARSSGLAPQSQAHLIAVAARAMRQILINHAGRRGARKRGGGWTQITLDPGVRPTHDSTLDIVSLNEALADLERLDPRQARVVELRFFGGLTNEQVAQVMHLSPRTVQLEWRMARLWLRRRLEEGA